MTGSTFAAFRKVTGPQRPPADHGCKPVEVFPGIWTAHFHDIEDKTALDGVSKEIKTVVNCATDKCPTKAGSYGSDVEVVCIEGLLDDPDAVKKVDAMPEGEEKSTARAALPTFTPEECAGDAKKDFELVNGAIEAAKAAGGATMIHCHASLSRSVAFILAYVMKTEKVSAIEAAKRMKKKWSAVWPNDTFVKQLLDYEQELGLAGTPGEVEMKVTTKRSAGFYASTAKSFFTSSEGKEAVCVLHISGLGAAVNAAVAAAAAVESSGLGVIKKVETSYPALGGKESSRGFPRICVTLWKK